MHCCGRISTARHGLLCRATATQAMAIHSRALHSTRTVRARPRLVLRACCSAFARTRDFEAGGGVRRNALVIVLTSRCEHDELASNQLVIRFRGLVVNWGFATYAGGLASSSLVAFYSVFGVAIALLKDTPDTVLVIVSPEL